MDELTALRQARQIMTNVTPLKDDCGLCCGHACCAPDEDGQGGMWLFPMEETLYAKMPDGFIIREIEGRKLLTCAGHCDRAARPLSCMLFPLLPKDKDGRIVVVRDRRGFCVCPLLESGLGGFDLRFKDAVREAGKILYEVPAHRAFLNQLHDDIDALKCMTL